MARKQATAAAEELLAPEAYVPHASFAAGLPFGLYRVVVNPKQARPYVVNRTRVNLLAVTLICIGAVLAFAGHTWVGAVAVALGIGANRLVGSQAAKIVLHLALKDPRVYHEVITNGVMEVRAAA
jgi:hypothetical protein